jgi:hypothetical protein
LNLFPGASILIGTVAAGDWDELSFRSERNLIG